MVRYDLHIHTNCSMCSIAKPEKILKIAKKKGMNGIAVTDHDTIKGAEIVRRLNDDSDFEVIIASEIKTNFGDLLVYYQTEEIKERDFFDVMDRARQQGAITSIAHPYRIVPWLRFRHDLIKARTDAIETFNSRTIPFENRIVKKFVERNKLSQTGGSDAHFDFDVGNGYTVFEGDLRKAIKMKKTRTGGTIKLGLISLFGSKITHMISQMSRRKQL